MFILVCCVDVGSDYVLHVDFPCSYEKVSFTKIFENFVLYNISKIYSHPASLALLEGLQNETSFFVSKCYFGGCSPWGVN